MAAAPPGCASETNAIQSRTPPTRAETGRSAGERGRSGRADRLPRRRFAREHLSRADATVHDLPGEGDRVVGDQARVPRPRVDPPGDQHVAVDLLDRADAEVELTPGVGQVAEIA